MAKSDPTKEPEFKRVLGNLLKTPHKTQAEVVASKRSGEKKIDAKPVKAKRRRPVRKDGP